MTEEEDAAAAMTAASGGERRRASACGGGVGGSGVRRRAAWGGGGGAVALCHDMILIYVRIIVCFLCFEGMHARAPKIIDECFFLLCRYVQ